MSLLCNTRYVDYAVGAYILATMIAIIALSISHGMNNEWLYYYAKEREKSHEALSNMNISLQLLAGNENLIIQLRQENAELARKNTNMIIQFEKQLEDILTKIKIV